jgi:hypothetical protein
MWWESLLDDKEINLTNSNSCQNSCLGSGSTANQEPINSLFVEDNPPGGTMIADVFSDQGQNRWGGISFDADLWNLIDTSNLWAEETLIQQRKMWHPRTPQLTNGSRKLVCANIGIMKCNF